MKINKTISRCVLAAAIGAALSPLAKMPRARAADPVPMTTSMMNASALSLAPSQVTGIILNHYVDAMGNLTAVDIQTANGIQMVRWSPPIAAGDVRLNGLAKGSGTTVTGVVTAGVGSYSPDASAHNSPIIPQMPLSLSPTGPAMAMKPAYPFDVSIEDLMNRVVSMNVTTATPTPGSFKSLVTLTDGRVTVVRSIDGRSYYIDPEDGRMFEVTGLESDSTMKPLRHRVGRGARITTLSADGRMAEPMTDIMPAKPM